MQQSLDFFTMTLGVQVPDKVIRKHGTIPVSSLGFDSPLLMLSPSMENKLGVGVEFYFGMNGSKQLDEFFTTVTAKGIMVICEPNHPNDTPS